MINLLLSINNFDEDWCYRKVKQIIHPSYKVLIIPFSYHEDWLYDSKTWHNAFDKNGTHYEDIVKPFKRYEINEDNIQWVNQFEDSIDLIKQKIQSSDILFFTGGYPDKMYERFIDYDLVETLESFDGIVIGMSAGAMVQIDEYHISPDQDYDEYMYCKGLNMINHFSICVHFNNSELENINILRAIREKHKPIYSITDKGAVLVIGNNIYALGEVEYWKVQGLLEF